MPWERNGQRHKAARILVLRDIDVIERLNPLRQMLGSMMFEGGDIIRERRSSGGFTRIESGRLFVAMNHKQLETLENESHGATATAQLELLDRGHSSGSSPGPGLGFTDIGLGTEPSSS